MNDVTTPVRQKACPSWCTDHSDLSDRGEWMVEHRTSTLTTTAAKQGATREAKPEPAKVWTASWEDENGPEPHMVLMEVPSCEMGWTQLTALEAARLAGSLMEAAKRVLEPREGQETTQPAATGCPAWCDKQHEPAELSEGLHHRHSLDGVPLVDLPGRDESDLEVAVSLWDSPTSAADGHVPFVEVHGLENSGSVDLSLLTAGEARRLAGWLVEAADLIEAAPAVAAAATSRRPFWQTEPCPSWCIRWEHLDTDHPEDRCHYSGECSADGRIDLSVMPLDEEEERQTLDSYLQQHVREVEPRLHLVPNETRGLELTLAEATRLRDRLTDLLEVARRV